MANDDELPHGQFWSRDEVWQRLESLEHSYIESGPGPADHRRSICIVFEQCGWTEEEVEVSYNLQILIGYDIVLMVVPNRR